MTSPRPVGPRAGAGPTAPVARPAAAPTVVLARAPRLARILLAAGMALALVPFPAAVPAAAQPQPAPTDTAGSTTAPAPGSGPPCRVVAEFAGDRSGDFPTAWRPRDDAARRIYRVLADGGLRFVRATAEGTGSQMGLEFLWDLRTHPVLAWRWRPRVFPEGADERDGGKNDSALGVYAVFPAPMMTVRTVKYVWSLGVPVGTTASASAGLTRMVVLRSGPPAADGWVAESVDVAADYQRLFGRALETPRGIAVLTDADQTRKRAEGDYADFRVCPAGATP